MGSSLRIGGSLTLQSSGKRKLQMISLHTPSTSMLGLLEAHSSDPDLATLGLGSWDP